MADYEVRQSGGGGQAWLAGLLIGVALGLIFAPRTGSETRQIIREKAQEAKDHTDEFVGRFREATGRVKGAAQEAMRSKTEEPLA